MSFNIRALAFFVAVCAVCGCGAGGSMSVLPTGSTAQAGADASSVTFPLSGLTSTTMQLPVAGGFGGSATFAAASAPSSITATASTTAPAGFALGQSTVRRPQSGTLSFFYYLTIVPKATITLPSVPSMNLTLPPGYASQNQQFYYALSRPAPSGVALSFQTEGPGTVAVGSVVFGAS